VNKELFEKNLCNQSSHYEKYGQLRYAKEAITCNHQINAFHCQQNNPKEDNGKPLKNALDVLQYAKRHLSG